MTTGGFPERDRLPRWLFERYGHPMPFAPWDELPQSSRLYWQHEADTVIRAVIKMSIYHIVADDER